MDGVIKFCAQYLIAVVVLIVIYTFIKIAPSQRKRFVAGLIMAIIIAGVLDKIAGKLYYDPRPFVSQGITPLIPHTADNGFPSEHTIAAMTLSSFIYFYRKKYAAIAFALTLIIGIARVAAHVHSPIDIIGGLVIGVIAGYSGYFLATKIIRKS